MNRSITFLSLFLIATAVSAKDKNVIYSPDQGVLCDKKSGFCADSYGISVAFTKEFLGDKAAKNLQDQIGDPNTFDATSFTMSNGVHCETKQKSCTVSKYDNKPDPVGNGVLFGQDQASAPEAAPADKSSNEVLFSPDQGIICDRKGNFCADDQGMSVAFSKEYLGEKAEKHLMALIHSVGGADKWDGSSFGLSNGVSCDTKARRCTGNNAEGYTKLLFGN